MRTSADSVDTRMGTRSIAGRYAHLHQVRGDTDAVAYNEHDRFDSVALGSDSVDVELNSVLLLRDLLTPTECELLVADVERTHAVDNPGVASGHQRYMLEDLSDSSRLIFDTMLRDRLLPFVATELPLVAEMIWARSLQVTSATAQLHECPLKFSAQEPAINRYSEGGHFEPHTDKLALTVNVLLATGTFSGGGTQFWREGAEEAAPALLIQPALAGVGVIFNGTVKHAGRAVTRGVRHLLVASFSVVRGAAVRRDAAI